MKGQKGGKMKRIVCGLVVVITAVLAMIWDMPTSNPNLKPYKFAHPMNVYSAINLFGRTSDLGSRDVSVPELINEVTLESK